MIEIGAKMYDEEAYEDKRLYTAALESLQTGKLTPLLKEELKYRIQTRRMSEGKQELTVTFSQPPAPAQNLRPEEIERQENRKIQNRRAATKFRQKRKNEVKVLMEECSELESRNSRLRNEVAVLSAERETLWNQFTAIFSDNPNNAMGSAIPAE